MAKESKAATRSPDSYGELVQRLEAVVKQLETGELTLEDSLKAFEEGVGLVNRGEKLLGEAERRIEQLLEQGGEAHVAALEAASPAAAAALPSGKGKASSPASHGEGEEDVPF